MTVGEAIASLKTEKDARIVARMRSEKAQKLTYSDLQQPTVIEWKAGFSTKS